MMHMMAINNEGGFGVSPKLTNIITTIKHVDIKQWDQQVGK